MQREIIPTTDGHRIAVLHGDCEPGPPIVFIHGILGSIEFWPPNLPPSVMDRTRWYSIGLPGHHPSSFPPGFDACEFTPRRLADTLEEVFQQLFDDEPIAICGYSTGGFAAMNQAIHYPQRVSNILSIAGFANGRWSGNLGQLQRLVRKGRIGQLLFRGSISVLTANACIFNWIHQAASRRTPTRSRNVLKETTRAVYQDAAKHSASQLAILFRRLREINIVDSLESIQAATLIVSGAHDSIIPYEHARQIAATIPNAQLVTLPESGHLVFADCPEAYRELLIRWVESLPSVRPSADCQGHGSVQLRSNVD